MQTMALAPVRLALTALPVMQRQGHGRIVTIASIGGKLGVPHLLPYTTIGASLPLLSMDAEQAARQIIEAVRARRAEIILTPGGQLVCRVGRPGAGADQRSPAPGPAADAARAGRAARSRNRRRGPRPCAEPGPGQEGLRPPDRPRPGRGHPLQRAAPGSTAFWELTGRRSGADDLLRGPDPEFFEQVCLAPRPGHELVELLGVQPHVRVRQRPQGAPACRLAFYA